MTAASDELGMTLQADFSSQDYFRNPAAEIEKLRAAGPVVEVRFPDHRQGLDDDDAGRSPIGS